MNREGNIVNHKFRSFKNDYFKDFDCLQNRKKKKRLSNKESSSFPAFWLRGNVKTINQH